MAKKWQHNPIGAVSGAPPAGGKPDAYAWEGDKTQHIVYRGMDNQVHEIYYKRGMLGGKWLYGGALSEKTGAPQAASDPNGFAWEWDETQHIVYAGADRQVHEIWFKKGVTGAKWSYGGALSDKTDAPQVAGNPWGFVWEEDKTQHIVYRGVDNKVHEIWFKKGITGAKWQYGGALSEMVGAPPAAGDPAGFAWEHDKTQHIVYRGGDNNIHEIWFKKGLAGAKWSYGGAMNQTVGAPQAAGNVMGYAWEGDKTQHLVYRGVDNQVHEIWFRKGLTGAKWQYGGSISEMCGAPKAAGDPFGYAWEGDDTQHIVYRGVDNQIHELWFRKTLTKARWQHGGALSAMTSGPQAASDPVGFAWEDDNTQHVIYRGVDNQIHELWFRK